ncbi:hypothetical protein OS493_037727, partial [Desmophyllum pertusum]
AAVESVDDASQVTTGETAKLYFARSVHESRKDYREARASLNNTILPSSLKTDFYIWNSTHLILMIKHTTFNDSGDYAVEYVFGGVTDNEKTMKRLQIVEGKPTTTSTSTKNGPSQEVSPNSTSTPGKPTTTSTSTKNGPSQEVSPNSTSTPGKNFFILNIVFGFLR